MKWTFVVLIDLHYRHDIPCKQFYYIFEFVKVQSKVLSVPFPQTQCLCGHNIMHISLPYDVYIYFAGTTAGTQPKCGNGGVSDAVTSELGDRQSSHPVKNPASILWQVFRGVARCCLPRSQGQPQHLKYQNWILKKNSHTGQTG